MGSVISIADEMSESLIFMRSSLVLSPPFFLGYSFCACASDIGRERGLKGILSRYVGESIT
jgi:hypothetical protein